MIELNRTKLIKVETDYLNKLKTEILGGVEERSLYEEWWKKCVESDRVFVQDDIGRDILKFGFVCGLVDIEGHYLYLTESKRRACLIGPSNIRVFVGYSHCATMLDWALQRVKKNALKTDLARLPIELTKNVPEWSISKEK